RAVYAALRDVEQIKAQVGDLKLQYKNLNTQLANVTDVASNNRLVGALNATVSEIEQLQTSGTAADERLKEARKKAAELRDQYLVDVLEMRADATAVSDKWSALAGDSKVVEALAAVNQALGTKLAIQPSPSFAANLKQIKTMEEAVTAEAIKLDNERNSLWV